MSTALPPLHPGELLREDILPALGITVSEMAEHLGVSRQTLHAILSERAAVTPAMALRLGKLCGNGPEIWLNLQAKWDIATLTTALSDELDRIPTLTTA
ncbi:HigA family addiction module antitoxin [Rhodospirillum centenum]|uniref:Proteic killer active protein, putative n=1 Tax=Rhodospirillum centenum (strain ATCC 51521 / SW) TaxID=414684 RepID=B6IV39_RHOCS|nr:HigA family addiction module antitoxin [Rhodospirillum centenum]ACJ00163.1 proteic killer active protein, putative [Rhodospirillum centenum SW]